MRFATKQQNRPFLKQTKLCVSRSNHVVAIRLVWIILSLSWVFQFLSCRCEPLFLRFVISFTKNVTETNRCLWFLPCRNGDMAVLILQSVLSVPHFGYCLRSTNFHFFWVFSLPRSRCVTRLKTAARETTGYSEVFFLLHVFNCTS